MLHVNWTPITITSFEILSAELRNISFTFAYTW